MYACCLIGQLRSPALQRGVFGLLLGWVELSWVELCSDWQRKRSFFTVISQHHNLITYSEPVTAETEEGKATVSPNVRYYQ